MANQNQVTANQQKTQNKPQKQAGNLNQQSEGAAVDSSMARALLGTMSASSGQELAPRLADSRFLSAQRQTMAAQISRVNGNRALQRVVAHMRETGQQKVADTPARDNGIQQSQETIVQREGESGDHAAWATSKKSAVERVQDAVPEAVTRLNTDATAAIGHIRSTQTAYNSFDEKYERAVGLFVGGVAAAQAREQEFRDNLKFVATSLLAVQAPLISGMYGAMDGVLTKVQRVSSIINTATTPAAPANRTGDSSPAMAARRENRVDWSELLSTTLTAFENTLQNNATLNSVSRSCVQVVRFLDNVEDGRYTGANPETDPLGVKANRIAESVENILARLREIDQGTVSTATNTLATQVAERLNGITVQRLQQDLAIRWMAGLPQDQLDQIDTADAYLKEIGVIDSQGNRLGYDTGSITTDVDERIIHWRAQWENTAMGLVGSTATWLGSWLPMPPVIDDGRRCIQPRVYAGRARDSRNRVWNVQIPRGVTTTEGGGQLLLESYQVNHQDSSGWEWSYPAALQRELQYEIQFIASPLGSLGGGASAPGPVIHAPD